MRAAPSRWGRPALSVTDDRGPVTGHDICEDPDVTRRRGLVTSRARAFAAPMPPGDQASPSSACEARRRATTGSTVRPNAAPSVTEQDSTATPPSSAVPTWWRSPTAVPKAPGPRPRARGSSSRSSCRFTPGAREAMRSGSPGNDGHGCCDTAREPGSLPALDVSARSWRADGSRVTAVARRSRTG